jgi:hypothetical protein
VEHALAETEKLEADLRLPVGARSLRAGARYK